MSDIAFNNYEMHKQMYAQQESLTADELNRQLSSVGAWFSTSPFCNYYMLMCKEISYYTVFKFKNMDYQKGIEELREVLDFRGAILGIDYEHDQDAYECWVKNEDNEVEMYYLFKYDWGVVEIE